MDILLASFLGAFTPSVMIYVAAGVFLGLAVGAIPGLSAAMAIALAVPLTYTLSPVASIGFLVGVYKGGSYGGSLSAILLNTPGAPEAAATTFDGYPLARKGKGMKAIKMSLVASVFGDVFSTLLLIAVAAPIASLALKMGPSEMCALIIFSLTLISVLESGSLFKGILATSFGMLLSTVGMDPVAGMPRMTLGIFQLESGLRLVAIAIGTLALAELIIQSEDPDLGKDSSASMLNFSKNPEDNSLSFREVCSHWRTLLRSVFIGSGVGALPGLGAAVAGFLAYGAARSASKNPENFGQGELDGVAAPESANNAVVGASLIPLFTLGIPGSVTAALLIGAFMLQGVTPGPLMFEQHPEMIYGIYGSLVVGNIMLLVIGYLGIRLFTRILGVPRVILMPCIMFICLVGAYLESPTVFSVGSMVALALLGYFMKKLKFSFVCFIVGFILGPMFELYVQQVVIGASGDYLSVLCRPATAVILLCTAGFVAMVIYRRMNRNAC
ncbi:tripartite tricarboxylate transporter permease [Mailhella massiliensis]|uniref:tripartite tricarboxylate transporter permease n=1 Tax=Mailhella massiliensis TaxID=1903261 RepID=UPI0023523366|nr:tripartite tricarboxylate transporter permease [Mailhella massiliensis]